MPKKPDYVEWEAEDGVPEQPKSDSSRIATLFDAEIRRRVGDVIARASEGPEKPKK